MSGANYAVNCCKIQKEMHDHAYTWRLSMHRLLKLFLIISVAVITGCSDSKKGTVCSVSFDTRGGEAIPAASVEYGQTLEVEDPVREGYTFDGWYSSPDLSAKWNKDDKVTEDTVLYASWTKQTKTISFDTGGADPLESVTLPYGSVFAMPSMSLAREGYGFQGWFYDTAYQEPYSGSFEVTEDVTFHALWKELNYNEIKIMNLISQNDYGVVNGTEAASLLMALQASGHALDYDFPSFLKNIPYSYDGNPEHGFAGDLWADSDQIDAILPSALAEWGNNYGNAEDISGCDPEELIEKVMASHPVIVWVSGRFQTTQPAKFPWGTYRTNPCVMVLCGYDEGNNSFLVADPTGYQEGQYWIGFQQFKKVWSIYPGAVEIY